jgi:hypothetical protein
LNLRQEIPLELAAAVAVVVVVCIFIDFLSYYYYYDVRVSKFDDEQQITMRFEGFKNGKSIFGEFPNGEYNVFRRWAISSFLR